MTELLLEIGTEELPAAVMEGAATSLGERVRQAVADLGLGGGRLRVFSTPRRLAVRVEGVREEQAPEERLVRGPARKAAFDAEGRPTRAAEGFARSQGVPVEELFVQDTPQGEYVFARVRREGRPAREVLGPKLAEVIRSLPFSRTMRWGSGELRFARPIRWLVCLLGPEVVPLQLDGLRADRISRGHRVLGPGTVTLSQPGEYEEALRAAYVVADRAARRRLVEEQVRAAAAGVGVVAEVPPSLLEEVVDLVEWPMALAGRFPEEYLSLPDEVLTTTMIHHQRFFPTRREDGTRAAYFVSVRNGGEEATVRAGNERVLRARLADAAFFFASDVRRPLADRVQDLERVSYQSELGTVYERVQRLQRLCAHLARDLNLEPADRGRLERAAWLSKADLTTQMVFEFPELQGRMGRVYALQSGEEAAVADAIGEQYQPQGADDGLPRTVLGRVLAVADKLDALVGHFAAGLAPTGSQDPYGLRRHALGLIRIGVEEGVPPDLQGALAAAAEGYRGRFPPRHLEEQVEAVRAFLGARLQVYLEERGIRPDVAEAVLSAGFNHLADVWPRARATQAFLERPEAADLLVAYRRASRLVQGAGEISLDGAVAADQEEDRALDRALAAAEQAAEQYLSAGDLDGYFRTAAGLRPAVDEFLNRVLVMVEDPALRRGRLGLLARAARLMGRVADLGRLSVEGLGATARSS